MNLHFEKICRANKVRKHFESIHSVLRDMAFPKYSNSWKPWQSLWELLTKWKHSADLLSNSPKRSPQFHKAMKARRIRFISFKKQNKLYIEKPSEIDYRFFHINLNIYNYIIVFDFYYLLFKIFKVWRCLFI